MLRSGLPAVLAALSLAGAAAAQAPPPEAAALPFAAGGTHAAVSGAVRGEARAAYTLEVKTGQQLTLALGPPNSGVTADLLGPEGGTLAIDIGTEHPWMGAVPTNGLHSVVVYLRPAAAQTGARVPFTLTVDRK
jgi:hypothetical protein